MQNYPSLFAENIHDSLGITFPLFEEISKRKKDRQVLSLSYFCTKEKKMYEEYKKRKAESVDMGIYLGLSLDVHGHKQKKGKKPEHNIF